MYGIQKLLLKYDFVEDLITGVCSFVKNKTVIDGIKSNHLFRENSQYKLLKGKIESLEVIEDKTKPYKTYMLIVNFIEESSNNIYKIEYQYHIKNLKLRKEIEQNIGQDITIVIEERKYNNEIHLHLCCLLKEE